MSGKYIYVGNASNNGICKYKFIKGKLLNMGQTSDFNRCTYLASTKSYLYGVLEIKDPNNNKDGYVVSYKKHKGKLIYIDKKSSYGQEPCHIEVNKKRNWLLISNYRNGYFTILKINKKGKIEEKIYSNVENNIKSHVHCAKMSKNNKFIFMVDLGEDSIIAYEIQNENIKEVSRIKFENGTQPRHIALRKNKIYLVTEKSCKLYILEFKNKKLKIINEMSILPPNTLQNNDYTGCAIKLSKNFGYIYVTIRGLDCINIYKDKGKKVKYIQSISSNGNVPRDLALSQKEKYVLVANQDSNEISIFKRNRITGKIFYKGKEKNDLPTCIII